MTGRLLMTRARTPSFTAMLAALAIVGLMLDVLLLFAGYAASFALGQTSPPSFEHVQEHYTVVPPWTPACCAQPILMPAHAGWHRQSLPRLFTAAVVVATGGPR